MCWGSICGRKGFRHGWSRGRSYRWCDCREAKRLPSILCSHRSQVGENKFRIHDHVAKAATSQVRLEQPARIFSGGKARVASVDRIVLAAQPDEPSSLSDAGYGHLVPAEKIDIAGDQNAVGGIQIAARPVLPIEVSRQHGTVWEGRIFGVVHQDQQKRIDDHQPEQPFKKPTHPSSQEA